MWNLLCIGTSCFGSEVLQTVSVFVPLPSYELYHNFTEPLTTSNITLYQSGCPDPPLRLVVLILSSPRGVMRRNAIRGTWLHNYNGKMIKVTSKFLVGTKHLSQARMGNLTMESGMFRDILFLPELKDSYSNLSSKVLMGLQWAHKNVDYHFLIKADDDSYVRLERLATVLQKLDCDEKLYWGYFMGYAFPEATGKWTEKKWFMCPHYLPYAMGGGYVLSRRVVAMLMYYPKRLRYYSNEDVTVGSWLAPFKLHRKHDLRFDVESLSRGCNNNNIISHKERVITFYAKHGSLLKNKTLCLEEREVRPGYVYNWTATPLNCCERIKGLPVPSLDVP